MVSKLWRVEATIESAIGGVNATSKDRQTVGAVVLLSYRCLDFALLGRKA
jgi:hypothetical protein